MHNDKENKAKPSTNKPRMAMIQEAMKDVNIKSSAMVKKKKVTLNHTFKDD